MTHEISHYCADIVFPQIHCLCGVPSSPFKLDGIVMSNTFTYDPYYSAEKCDELSDVYYYDQQHRFLDDHSRDSGLVDKIGPKSPRSHKTPLLIWIFQACFQLEASLRHCSTFSLPVYSPVTHPHSVDDAIETPFDICSIKYKNKLVLQPVLSPI